MKFKAIIFDMDGTIVDSEKIWKKATQILIEQHGVTYTPELHTELDEKIHGLATHKSCSIICEVLGLSVPIDELISQKRTIARELYHSSQVSLIEGFADFHASVREQELRHAIATNADDTTVHITDRAVNLRQFFGDHIYGISCVNNVCKPDPAIYLHAAQSLKVTPQECIAVEDSAHGVAAAQAAGMYTVGLAAVSGRRGVAKADCIVDQYCDIDLPKIFASKL